MVKLVGRRKRPGWSVFVGWCSLAEAVAAKAALREKEEAVLLGRFYRDRLKRKS